MGGDHFVSEQRKRLHRVAEISPMTHAVSSGVFLPQALVFGNPKRESVSESILIVPRSRFLKLRFLAQCMKIRLCDWMKPRENQLRSSDML